MKDDDVLGSDHEATAPSVTGRAGRGGQQLMSGLEDYRFQQSALAYRAEACCGEKERDSNITVQGSSCGWLPPWVYSGPPRVFSV